MFKPIRFIPDDTKIKFMLWSRYGYFASGLASPIWAAPTPSATCRRCFRLSKTVGESLAFWPYGAARPARTMCAMPRAAQSPVRRIVLVPAPASRDREQVRRYRLARVALQGRERPDRVKRVRD